MMSDEHTDARGSGAGSDGVPEVLAGKAGLVSEFFLNPGTEHYTWYSPGFKGFLCGMMGLPGPEYLSSWLYLAKRSDRHGAPVLI